MTVRRNVLVGCLHPLRPCFWLSYTTLETPSGLGRHGEPDGAASDAAKAVTDPIRLVRMVKEMEPLPRFSHIADSISFTLRDKHVRVGVFSVTAFSQPISLHQREDPAGVGKRGV